MGIFAPKPPPQLAPASISHGSRTNDPIEKPGEAQALAYRMAHLSQTSRRCRKDALVYIDAEFEFRIP